MKRNVVILFVVLLGLSWFTALSEAINDPKAMKEHLARAEAMEQKGIYVDAVMEYESALEYDPENNNIRLKLAQAYLGSDDSQNFILICEDIAEKDQNDTEAMNLLMNYYVENNYEDKAVRYLDDFIDAYPDNENAQKWFLRLKGSYEELYCRYTELGEFVNDTVVAKDGELYGIGDVKGSLLIPAEYKEANPFSGDGYALVQKENNEWIYIDEDNQTRKVPDKEYKDLGMFSEKRAAASKDGVFGYLNEDMEPAGKFVWDRLTGIRNGVGAALDDGKWTLVDKDGKEKSKERYDGVIIDGNGFCSGQKRIFVKSGKTYIIVNTKGKRVGELSFENAKAFTEDGFAAVCIDGKWGFVNTDGELVISCTYEDAESFQNGYAAVCTEGKWGYIDSDGNVVIEPVFSEAKHFSSEGTAVVRINVQGEEEWRLIQLALFQ